MRRANRLIQIEKLKRDVASSRFTAMESGKQPLALIMQYPATSMTVSALMLGLVTRGTIASSLPAALKILTIPVIRKLIRYAIVAYQKSKLE